METRTIPSDLSQRILNPFVESSPLINKYAGQAVLAIGAHPDDVELGAGGTVARLTEGGARVTFVVCAPNGSSERFEEARRAAKILGADLELLYGDRRAANLDSYELVERLGDLVTRSEPALVLTHASANFHQDHALVHKACGIVQRVRYFDMLCFCPTNAHLVATPFKPDAFVDISPAMEKKMAAIELHSDPISRKGLTTEHYRSAAAEYGRRIGVEYAEAFEVARIRLA